MTPLNYLRNPYPDGFVPIVGSSQGLLTGIGSSIAASIIGDSVTPYVENWSFNIQRLLPGALLIEAGYVGSHGVHLNDTGEGDVSINQLTAAHAGRAASTGGEKSVLWPHHHGAAQHSDRSGQLSSAPVPAIHDGV